MKILKKLVFIILIILNFNLKLLFAALDINLTQLKYLADHLSVKECKHFVASLHYKSFDIPRTIGNQVMKLDPDATCYELLKKWNSGKGKTATHSILATRLGQTGHNDLSLWLSASVFKQLTQNIENAIKGEDYEDRDIESHLGEITASEKSLENDIFENIDKDEDVDLDEVSIAELGGSFVAFALVIYGWVKLYRKFCKKNNDNK